MRRLLPAGLLLLALVAAASSLPARLLPRLVDDDLLRLSGLSGTLTEGRAARAVLATPAGDLHLGSLSWQLRPASLLRLAPLVDLESAWGLQRARLSASWHGSRLVLSDVDASLAASLVKAVAPLAVGGRLNLLMDEVILSQEALIAARGRMVWQDAVWQAPDAERALGSYALTLDSADEGVVTAEIETLAGPVFAAGSAEFQQQRYRITLRIDGGPRGLDADVERALQLFATPQEDGYLLRLDGELAGQ